MKTHNKQSIACNVIALSATMLSCCLAGAADPRQEFAEPPLKYATRPLWFWNNTTVTEEDIVKQMQEARDKCGYGGFGILPFGKEFKPTSGVIPFDASAGDPSAEWFRFLSAPGTTALRVQAWSREPVRAWIRSWQSHRHRRGDG
jgi:hypothetical protein